MLAYVRAFRSFLGKFRGQSLGSHLLYLRLYVRYNCPIKDYLEKDLYWSKEKRREYIKSSSKYARSWKNQASLRTADKGTLWRIVHFPDFCVSKLIYSGLDAADYFDYHFYDFRFSKRRTFVTAGESARLARKFNGRETDAVKNKAEFNRIFSQYVGRSWILPKEASEEEFVEFCRPFRQVIVKPLTGEKGRGIYIASTGTGQDRSKLYREVHEQNCIVEEIVRQHKRLAELNPSSVNTIRVNSVLKDGNIVITSAVLRIGEGSLPTDNFSAGGFGAVVDLETGTVVSRALDKEGNQYYYHPRTGAQIIGFRIPEWDQILAMVREAHPLIPHLRYVSWDVAITDESKAVLIEANSAGAMFLQQSALLTGKKKVYMDLL